MKYNFLGMTVSEFADIQNIGEISLLKAKPSKKRALNVSPELLKSKEFKIFVQEAQAVIKKISENEKAGNKDEVKKWHKKLDSLLHAFVGREGMTEEELKKEPDKKSFGVELNDLMKAKYIKRTGSAGNYKYTYADDKTGKPGQDKKDTKESKPPTIDVNNLKNRTYISSDQGEGYIITQLATGDYQFSMKKRAKEGRRVSPGEISKIWSEKEDKWINVAKKGE